MIAPVSHNATVQAPVTAKPTAGESFAAALNRATASHDANPRDQVREAARDLVSSAFIVPILAAMREASDAAAPFAPTTAEKRFGPLMDQQIADRITEAANFSLIDTIVDRYFPAERATA